ncbi:MAG: hypothetical protein ACI37U_02790 [Bacteroides sp.]
MGTDAWIQTGLLLVAVVTVIVNQMSLKKQYRIMMFSEYTRRYQDILMKMPESVLQGSGTLGAKELVYMRLYFDLCSEEYHLWKSGILPDKIWALWKEGMEITTNRPVYKQAWLQLSGEYNRDFWRYFSNEIIKHKKDLS